MNRNSVVSKAREFFGKGILSIQSVYNSIKPLPVGYKLKISDNWCAAFVSSIFWSLGYTEFPFECSVARMIKKAQSMGIWCENDGLIPKIGDLIVYDWQDSGYGDNIGNPDHIGIVVNVSGYDLQILEGNKNHKVGIRSVRVNCMYIRGYIIPRYTDDVSNGVDITSIAKDVIKGKYGVMPDRKRKIEAMGISYDLVRSEVNRLLKR